MKNEISLSGQDQVEQIKRALKETHARLSVEVTK
jgi:hypothetical protein